MTSQPLRIVAADDDIDIIEYYVRMIPRMDHVLVASATNGLALVESCLGLHPDVVVTDIQMPELDGISAMERVQRETDIPFIFITADDETTHHDRLKHAKVLEYLNKPVKQEQLSSALKAAAAVVVAK